MLFLFWVFLPTLKSVIVYVLPLNMGFSCIVFSVVSFLLRHLCRVLCRRPFNLIANIFFDIVSYYRLGLMIVSRH